MNNEKLELLKIIGPTYYYRSVDNIIYMDSPKEQQVPIELDHMKSSYLYLKELSIQENRPLKVLVDFSKVRRISKETRDYMRGAEAKSFAPYIQGTALITNSQLSKMLGNFVLGTLKGDEETRLFTNEEKAIEWLKQL
ncbi:STAS/SEC14 domain-containing protein [Saprospira sp. CCB-QB6]|uniref:DUF7793 family protein n=1 Tax=Saprospira sp. CCB-QB6 TaxID=3023936 RepID=UPI00234B1E36|nr:STAS/SEC14 domain-containing protein [Saprospira sp. CCB-QB6]WCL80978.1 STAS/SEC14 domain-containing protein [Saprospira sp. CCB-QB6]